MGDVNDRNGQILTCEGKKLYKHTAPEMVNV